MLPHWGDPADFLSIYSNKPKLGLAQSGMGYVPQVLSMKDIHPSDFSSMNNYEGISTPLTMWLTPSSSPTTAISSALSAVVRPAPLDNTFGGENLLKDVYEKLRNSPIWYSSMLIVTYDEHGGFFDQMSPGTSTPPQENMVGSPNGFRFDNYGVRVPAIVISPLVEQGVATSPGDGSKPLYCHSSVPSTLRTLFNLGEPLNDRDESANNLLDLITLSIADNTYRSDCPETLPAPVACAVTPSADQEVDLDQIDLDKPIASRSNLVGALGNLAKVVAKHAPSKELADEVWALYSSIQTKRDAVMFPAKMRALLEAYSKVLSDEKVPSDA